MKKINSLFFFYCLLYLFSNVISFGTFASPVKSAALYAKDFNKQLFIINNLTDKKQALIKLELLASAQNIDDKQKLTIMLTQGRLLTHHSRFEDAIKLFFQAKVIAEKLNDASLEAEVNKGLGIVYYYQGALGLALDLYQKSLVFYEQEVSVKRGNGSLLIKKANLLNNIALALTSMGESTNSLYYYQRAEPLYQQYGSEQDKVDVRLNIGLLHVNLKRFDIAIAMLNEVIAKFELLGDHSSIAKATAGLGIAYKYSGKYEVAKDHTLKALQYYKNKGLEYDAASELHNLGDTYIYLLDYEKSIEYARKSIELSQKVGHQKAYAGALQTLARAHYYQGKLLLAAKDIAISNEIAKKMKYGSVLIDNLGLSALIYSGLGEHSKALVKFFAYDRHQHDADNLLLNEQLAKFESVQLAQQVIQLKQKRKLNELKATKSTQQRNFILVAVVLFLLLILSIYRRYLEKSLTTELESRVYQRTKELELTTKELQKANKIKSQFLANMSHEIRTPLTAIVGHAEAIIHDDVCHENLTNEVDIIHGNSLHLLELINDILDLSKIEANKFELDIRPQNLDEIIQELADMFSEQAQKKGLTFSIEHQLKFPFIIHADGRRLRQVLINLCSNAIKFTHQGNVILDVKLVDKNLVFTVTDTGIGLSEEQISQIFETFAQADSSISRRFGGSGLGLSLSNQLAKLMAGSITVQSRLAHGSSFIFSAPFTPVVSHDSLAIPSGARVKRSLPRDSCNVVRITGKILLADDHDDNRRLIARLLEGLGLEVLTATNGLEVIEACLAHNPPLVLLDIQMPEMDGVTAFGKLRELGFNQPIYALTANAMSHEIRQYLSLGFTGHLKKPIERISFINTIAQHYDEINSSDMHSHTSVSGQSEAIMRAAEHMGKINFDDLILDFKKGLPLESKKIALYFDERNREDLAAAVHRISGAGQMFGFTELSQLAKELDSYLKKLSSVEANVSLGVQDRQNDFIDGLVQCLIDEISLVQSS